jgi:hypothetical protein
MGMFIRKRHLRATSGVRSSASFRSRQVVGGRPQVAPTAARSSLADDAANFLPGFSGAREGGHTWR